MCIFCDIIEGKIPSAKVYEDDDVLAILDISQTTKGHTLVLPKKHYENFLQMPDEELGKLMSTVKALAEKICRALGASGVNVLINTNEAAGQTVMHAHVHIIPRYGEDDGIKISFSQNQLDLQEILNEING